MRVAELIGGPERWARRLGAVTVLGLALGVVGPFGSYLNDGAVGRMAFWTVLLWAGALILGLTVGPAARLAPRWGVPRLFAAAIATLAACAPLAALVRAAGRAAWPHATAGLRPLDWYAETLFIAAPLVAAAFWLESRGALAPPTPASAVGADPAPAAPLDALPARLREAALCLEMEDHYMRVHTARGSELVLLPMARAVEALGDRGLRVHRSWWVAREAVRRVEGEGRSLTVLTTTGLRAPVARNRIAALREAGWIGAEAPG